MKKRSKKVIGLLSPRKVAIYIAVLVVILIGWWFLPLRIFIGGALFVAIVSSVVLFRNIMSPEGFKSDLLLYITIIALIASLIALIEKGFVYTFIDEPFLPFWEISLIVGFLISSFLIVKWGRGGKLWAKIIGIPLLALVIALVAIMLMSHLNFVLDFHKTVECAARIEEKEAHRHTKSPDTYSFSVTINGETFDLEVDYLEYEKYENGDIYTFEKHQGAFGKAFYVSD